MTTFAQLHDELMGVAKTAPGEEAFGLTDAQIIDGLRGLVRKAEAASDRMAKEHNDLVDQAAKLTELRGVLKAILEDEDN